MRFMFLMFLHEVSRYKMMGFYPIGFKDSITLNGVLFLWSGKGF